MVINGVVWGPPWPEFCMHLSFISTNIFLSPKVFVFNQTMGFLKVLGGVIKLQNPVNRVPYIHHGEYTAGHHGEILGIQGYPILGIKGIQYPPSFYTVPILIGLCTVTMVNIALQSPW